VGRAVRKGFESDWLPQNNIKRCCTKRKLHCFFNWMWNVSVKK